MIVKNNMPAKKLLSLSIPTYSRAKYLKMLLNSISEQFLKNPELNSHINIYIFDNDSADDTRLIVKESLLPIFYKKNNSNIGGDANILQAYSKPNSEYIWVIGDDEILIEGSLTTILHNIKKFSPSLIINRACDKSSTVYLSKFANYKSFISFALKCNHNALIAHSLISSNVVKKQCFNLELSKSLLPNTCYCNFMGMIDGVLKSNECVIMPLTPTIYIRRKRAILYNNDPLKHNIENLDNYIKKKQIEYLEYIKLKLQLKKINPSKDIKYNSWSFVFFFIFFYPYSFLPFIIRLYNITIVSKKLRKLYEPNNYNNCRI